VQIHVGNCFPQTRINTGLLGGRNQGLNQGFKYLLNQANKQGEPCLLVRQKKREIKNQKKENHKPLICHIGNIIFVC